MGVLDTKSALSNSPSPRLIGIGLAIAVLFIVWMEFRGG